MALIYLLISFVLHSFFIIAFSIVVNIPFHIVVYIGFNIVFNIAFSIVFDI